jgi:hypothetical protein
MSLEPSLGLHFGGLIHFNLSMLFLLLIVSLCFRLRVLGRHGWHHRFLLHWRDYGFLLRRNGLRRIAILRVTIFLL